MFYSIWPKATDFLLIVVAADTRPYNYLMLIIGFWQAFKIFQTCDSAKR